MTALAPERAVVHGRVRFRLDEIHEAHEPPEARGLARDHVRLLVSDGDSPPVPSRFDEIGRFLTAGDLLVVNASATIPAALDGRLSDGEPVVVHLSGEMPGGVWLVEVRRPVGSGSTGRGTTAPADLEAAESVALFGGGEVRLLVRFAGSRRLWLAEICVPEPISAFLKHHGRPIRYRHVPRDWPLEAYQTVFGVEPGSAEMPSASRPFTDAVVTDLVRRGIGIAPLVLHTGVSSLEGGERPYPERYRVDLATADAINSTRRRGGRVIAGGTTVVRALATVTDMQGVAHPGHGWTDTVVLPDSPLPGIDGLLTGWHEPEASHLWMLEAVAGREPLENAYDAALGSGYLWHEFGDSHLLLRARVPATGRA